MQQDFDSSSGRRKGIACISQPALVRLDTASTFSFFNQCPELLGIGQSIFFITDRQVGPEKEILKRIPVQDPVHDHRLVIVGNLKIEANIARPVAIERFPVPLDLAKRKVMILFFQTFEIFRADFKFIEDFQLLQGGELGDLGCTDFVEDYLKHIIIIDRGQWRDK